MTRREFFEILIRDLRNIDPAELQDVLQYYNEYLDDAGIENEQATLAELGSPQKIATAIKANSTIRYLESSEKTSKKSLKAMWITLGAVFAAPIALPIAIVAAALVFTLIIICASVIFSFYAVAVALGLSGILLSIFSFFVITLSPMTFLAMLGSGFILAGLGLLFFIGTNALAKVSLKGYVLFVHKTILRKKGN